MFGKAQPVSYEERRARREAEQAEDRCTEPGIGRRTGRGPFQQGPIVRESVWLLAQVLIWRTGDVSRRADALTRRLTSPVA